MILKDIWMDVKAVQERDPAARSALEVLLLYQGVHALIWHRFAHWFYKHHMFFIARLISQIARFFTLIEIHPGAQLGHGILIDHGCGVVIGETTVVGDNCTIYQGVTLGGVGLNKGKRHPTLGNNVTVGCGAKILGAFEVGDNCQIAANAVLLKPLDNDTTAVGIPAQPIKVAGVPIENRKRAVTVEHFEKMEQRVKELEAELERLRAELAETINSDFMLLAKTKGLTERQATINHGIRNSMLPLMNIIVPMFTSIMGGSLVIETIFSIPGMGGIMVKSINAPDYTVTLAALIFYSVVSLVTVLIVDLSYGIVDPRVRMGGKK